MNAPENIALQHGFAEQLPELARKASAAPVPAPQLIVLNEPLARELGLDVEWLRTEDGVLFLLGLNLPEGAMPVAQLYSGHQFGGYSPQLGDGRALLLGEVETPDGLRDIHLKGSGPTPFTRGGDGLAALGPMLREFLVSESMHALGIPTTRSLAVVATGTPVLREEGALPGAVLVRVASSHLRVGTFQYARASNQMRVLVKLSRYALERHHTEGLQADNPPLALFDHVVAAQARLVAQWLTVGFVHGVMNTDNMTISGETIDYGPCAFLDAYDPGSVFSSIDTGGRYAYGNQPQIAQWNLARFAEALLPIIADEEAEAVQAGSAVLEQFPAYFNEAWMGAMAAKLGISADLADLVDLVTTLHGLLEASRVDFTTFFRDLTRAARGDRSAVHATTHDVTALDQWLDRWMAHSPDADAMDAVNPVHVPRNHLLDEALRAATAGDLGPYEALLAAVRAPFTPIEGGERYAQPAPPGFAEGFQTFCGT
ncbi:protein adenylyltransferase SelO [Nocardioides gilvus]|uniref:protein adenylyltransferase SelO n=1 Tax=Nocardioides gilvus TaxID=1735589 RepID=UPI000D74CB7F|nr:YdiU family protein [Nocardioides gilvus]